MIVIRINIVNVMIVTDVNDRTSLHQFRVSLSVLFSAGISGATGIDAAKICSPKDTSFAV